MASWCHQEIIHTWLVPGDRPRPPKGGKCLLWRLMGRGKAAGRLISRLDCNCPKVLASLMNVPTLGLPLRLPQGFCLLGLGWVMFF